MDWKQELVKALIPLAVTTIATLVALALAAIRRFADAKTGESFLFKALAILPHSAEAVWAEVEPSVEEELKKDAEDGVISKEELDALKAHAVEKLKASLSKNGLAALKDAFGPLLDGFLSKKIDAAAKASQEVDSSSSMLASPK